MPCKKDPSVQQEPHVENLMGSHNKYKRICQLRDYEANEAATIIGLARALLTFLSPKFTAACKFCPICRRIPISYVGDKLKILRSTLFRKILNFCSKRNLWWQQYIANSICMLEQCKISRFKIPVTALSDNIIVQLFSFVNFSEISGWNIFRLKFIDFVVLLIDKT